MLAKKSPQGILNFSKLINSSYKISTTDTENSLNVEVKLQGLEKTIGNLQKKINVFIKILDLPNQCKTDDVCEEDSMVDFFLQNEQIQNIFWDSLSDKLESDDILLNNLTYGEIWLETPGLI